MPIVNPDDDEVVAKPPLAVKIAEPEYRGVVVDTRYVPSASILTHIEGSKWVVNYYSQVLGEDSAVAGQNVNRNAIYQQYKLIKGFELKVTTPLNTSQDTDSGVMILTGAAHVYPMLIPNIGDMFLADIGDGREGIFRITSSERKAIFKDTCHFIEYQLIDYSTLERRSDLAAKVVQSLYFMSDFMQHGQNPLLQEEDFAIANELRQRYYDIANRYFKSFTSNEYKTLLVPGQQFPTYDHFLVKAVTAMFTTWDSPELRYIRKLNCDGDDTMHSMQLWDVLMERDKRMLKHCNRQSGLVGARTFDRNPMLEGIYYSGITYVVYPKDPELSQDYERMQKSKPLLDNNLTDVPSRVRSLQDLLEDTELDGYGNAPLLHRVLIDNHYVLSSNFYNNSDNQSKLELCVRDYLDGKALNNKVLLAFCNTYHSWGGLERFYYVPIVLMLIKASLRSI